MRKVLSFVLVLSLVLGSFGFAFAAPADVEDTDYESAVEVLMGLGVVSGYPDGTYKPDNTVTRAEMAKLLIVALGLDTLSGASTSSFSDMAGHWADNYVALATAKGLTKGYPDGTFKPDATVSFNEVITMIARALGYNDDFANNIGGWPIGYLELADDLDITDDATADATRGNVAVLLYNALTVEVVRINDELDTVKTGKRFIEKLGAELDTITIDDDVDIYDDEYTAIDLTEYFFASVDVFVDEDDVILAIDDENSDIVKGEFDESDDEVVNADGDDYDLNGKLVGSTPALINGGEGVVSDIDNYGSIADLDEEEIIVVGEFDPRDDEKFATIAGIIVWYADDIQLADEDDLEAIEEAIEDNDGGDVFDVALPTNSDDENDFSQIEIIGAVDDLEDIEENDVVYIYESAGTNNDRVRFEVIRDSVTGEVTKKNSTYVYIDGDKYKYNGLTEADFTLGEEVNVYLDKNGKAFGTDATEETETMYAVFVDNGEDTGNYNNSSSTYLVKLFTEDGEVVEFETDDSEVTGTALNALANKDLVTYDTNSKGKVTTISAIGNATDNATDAEYKSRTEALGNTFVASTAVVFDVETGSDGDDWKVTTMKDGATYELFTSDIDDDEIVALAFGQAQDASDDGTFMIITGIYNVVDPDDDDAKVQEVTGFVDGEEMTYLTSAVNVSKVDGDKFREITLVNGEIDKATDVAIDASWRTASAVGSGYVKAGSSIYEISDDVVVYVVLYDEDDDFDGFEVGSFSDVDDDDHVQLYDVYGDDDDDIDVIFVVNKADIKDGVTEPTL